MWGTADDLSGWGGPLLGAGAGFVLAAVARWIHRTHWGFLPEDAPTRGRKLHGEATPMVGFLLAAAATVILLAGRERALAAAVALLAGMGYVDDRDKQRGGLPWKAKALVQLAAAATVVAATAPRADLVVWLVLLALVFVVVNAVNFLDNMDGVAALVGGLGVVLAAPTGSSLCVAAATFLGFLPLNWPRPWLFLGDSGAYAVGALLAAASLRTGLQDGRVQWLALAAPCFVPLFDFVQVVSARLYLGYAPWVGDRRHITHIATYLGVPPSLVAPICGVVAAGAWFLLRGEASSSR
ncbi:MAG: hypothetical protein R3F56_18340 [Planctomycetota bacterium]